MEIKILNKETKTLESVKINSDDIIQIKEYYHIKNYDNIHVDQLKPNQPVYGCLLEINEQKYDCIETKHQLTQEKYLFCFPTN